MKSVDAGKCLGCGVIWDSKLDYCPYCGSPRPSHLISAIDSGLICPTCHKDDRVIKVTSIYRGDTQQINGVMPVSHSYTDDKGKTHSYSSQEKYSATQRSDLAIALTPPDEPQKPKFDGCLSIFLLIISLYFIGVGLSRFFRGDWEGIGFTFVLLITGILLQLWRDNVIKKSKEKLTVETEAWEKEYQLWQASITRWENLYYCYRDDTVFLPDTHTVAPLSEMRKLIYQGEKYNKK